MAEKKTEAAAPEGAAGKPEVAAASAAAGGVKAWLPLVITVVSMPVMAYVMTNFVLLPKLKTSGGQHAEEAASGGHEAKSEAKDDSHGGGGDTPGGSSKSEGGSKTKYAVPMSKMIVNIAGTMGTRYLMVSVTLVGKDSKFKKKIEDEKDQLLDLATGTLSGKTIAELEKPGARNQIRTELMSVLNNALGGSLIREIYITELAIQ
ncbi:MAG: flagellar basal body-associated FliL family protein [Pedosphaera sp.]|nr:flagellar basal body-associated FliL family protein [Pedosphaera sp.]